MRRPVVVKQQCEAVTREGMRCRRGVMRAGGGRFCVAEERGIARPVGERQCEAVTREGMRCRQWAMRDSAARLGRWLCVMHGVRGPVCEEVTARGKGCRRRALADSRERYGRWLCVRHVPGYVFPVPPEGRRCEATTLAGERCKRWARAEEGGPEAACHSGRRDPLLCVAHGGAGHPHLKHGYYRRLPYFSAVEAAYVTAMAREGRPLGAELFVMRLKVQGLLAYLGEPELADEERARAAGLLLRAVRLIGAMVRARRGLGTVVVSEATGGRVRELVAREAGG